MEENFAIGAGGAAGAGNTGGAGEAASAGNAAGSGNAAGAGNIAEVDNAAGAGNASVVACALESVVSTSPVVQLYGTVLDSIVDGPGLRYAVFVQGCSHKCPGCHNAESQPRCGGTSCSVDALIADIQANGLVHDVTLSGGEPFEQASALAVLAQRLKALGYGVWTYTGYLYEDLQDVALGGPGATCAPLLDPVGVKALLDATDVLVDGPFVENLKSLGLMWRGSSNQRLIDLSASRAAGKVVLWEEHQEFPHKPASW